jgi:monoamine oxidase
MATDATATVGVVVIGAGFAGLTAATELERVGHDVLVIEARDRVGGKVASQLDETGRRIDIGGQFVCDDMPYVLSLVQSFGMDLITVDDSSNGVAFIGGGTRTDDPHRQWAIFGHAEHVYGQLWADDAAVPHAGQSLGDWLTSLAMIDDVLAAARSSLSGIMCIDVDKISLDHVIDLARRTPLTRDELQYVVGQTMQTVADRMAAELARPVQVASPVHAVVEMGAQVEVRTDHDRIRARHVVVAVPPTAVRSIDFTPALPARTAAAIDAFTAGSVIKFMVGYQRPFWRDRSSSTAAWLQPQGLYVTDASLPGSPMLVGFLGGPASFVWRALTADERRQALLAAVVEAFGDEAADPVSYVERDWPGDQWGAGGYWNVLTDPGVPEAVETLRAGLPRITFASTELAPTFPGYVEGAITAGRHAAQMADRLLNRR